MKQFLHKIASLLMAFVVLFSTLSFTVDMHYCGDRLVDTAVFSKAKTCGMEMESTTNTDCETVKKDCCNEQQINFEGQDELKTTSKVVPFEQQLFVTAFIQSYINLFIGEQHHTPLYKNYSPPIAVKNIHKLDEIYLL